MKTSKISLATFRWEEHRKAFDVFVEALPSHMRDTTYSSPRVFPSQPWGRCSDVTTYSIPRALYLAKLAPRGSIPLRNVSIQEWMDSYCLSRSSLTPTEIIQSPYIDTDFPIIIVSHEQKVDDDEEFSFKYIIIDGLKRLRFAYLRGRTLLAYVLPLAWSKLATVPPLPT